VGNALLRGVTLTGVSPFLALHTGDPGEAGSANEVATGAYVRKAITFGAPADGVFTSTNAPEFTATGAAWGEISYLSIWDAETVGNCLFQGAATAPLRTIADGDIWRAPIGSIVCTIT